MFTKDFAEIPVLLGDRAEVTRARSLLIFSILPSKLLPVYFLVLEKGKRADYVPGCWMYAQLFSGTRGPPLTVIRKCTGL